MAQILLLGQDSNVDRKEKDNDYVWQSTEQESKETSPRDVCSTCSLLSEIVPCSFSPLRI